MDLVIEVTLLRLLRRTQYSKAARMIRSVPRRVNMLLCTTISKGVPVFNRPPTGAYSPSVFSRKITMSMSPGFLPAKGEVTPGYR